MKKTVKVLLASVALMSSVSATVSVFAQDNSSVAHLQQLKNKEDAKKLAAALKPTIDAENNARKVYEARVNEHEQVLNVYNTATETFRLAEIEYKKVRVEATQDVEKEDKRLNDLIAVGQKETADLTTALGKANKTYEEAKAEVSKAEAKLSAAETDLEAAKQATPKQDIAPLEKAVASAKAALASAEATRHNALNQIASLSKEINVSEARVKEAENTKAALNIDNVVAVVNARQAFLKAEAARDAAAAKLSVTRANLEQAEAALNDAIKANEINHLQHGAPYKKVVPQKVEKTQAEKDAEKIAGKATGKATDKAAGKATKTVQKGSVAKTATGKKVLPKTSAAK